MKQPAGLNAEQAAALAAFHTGSVAVLAGPGSGKTHTLAAAIRDTLQVSGETPLLCLTFTNKAAENLRGKLPASSRLFVGTFHALAAQLIGKGGGEQSIADTETLLSVLGELQRGQDLNARELGLLISRCKNGADSSAGSHQLVQAYDSALAARGLMDYDDLILRALEGAAEAAPYTYIFVDEFQDTSPKQYELLLKLARPITKLFAIGDPNQSIYRFRGADGSVFTRFQADKSPQTVTFRHNYRSTAAVVRAAGRIFPDTPAQQARRPEAGRATSIETLDEYSEAAYIARVIEQALGGTEWQGTHHDQPQVTAGAFRDFAVLYRTRRQGTLLARKLRGGGLPVQCLGEESPYMSPLVQLLRAALAYIVNPDAAADATLRHAAQRARQPVKPAQFDGLDPASPPEVLIRAAAGQLAKPDDDIILQLENLAAPFASLDAFLSHLDDLADQAFFDPAADAVCLSTIHSSKGLEFRHVFVAGCNEGLLPSRRAMRTEDVAEEQRLFYVALTRARDSVTLLHARRLAGQAAQPSRFLTLAAVPGGTEDGLPALEQARQRQRQKRAQQKLL